MKRVVTQTMLLAAAVTVLAIAPGASADNASASAGGLIVYSSGTIPAAGEAPEWDLFVSAPDGSGRSRLTSLATYESYPEWSPDGTRIVFSYGGDECTPPPGGDTCGGNNLYLVDADGSNVTLLTTDARYVDNQPTWMPDGSTLVFTSERNTPFCFGSNPGNYDLFSMPATPGAGATSLTNTPQSESNADVSPDGTKIVYQRGSDCAGANLNIMVMDINGSNQTPLVAGDSPSWSPDGTQIAFTSSSGVLSVMNADGTGIDALGVSGSGASWSPDGTQIAYMASRDGDSDIYVINADGTGDTKITFNSIADLHPHWHPVQGPGATPPAECSKPGSICTGDENDEVEGTSSDDFIWTGAGDDVIDAGAGSDTVDAGAGHDSVWAGPGADHVLGGAGDDTILGDSLAPTHMRAAQGESSADTLEGGTGEDTINGEAGGDRLDGGADADSLNGGGGGDSLKGGGGKDILRGAKGFDLLNGGAGRDTCFVDSKKEERRAKNCERFRRNF